MSDMRVLAPNYQRAADRWPQAESLRGCHDALAACFESDGHGLVERTKSFIESVCITILAEFQSQPLEATASTTQLLVAALKPLGLQGSKSSAKLGKVLSGFNKLSDALTDMRNEHGAVAHGRDGFLDAISADHSRAFLHTGDAILSVLLNALEGKEPNLQVTREPYERFAHHNERIDRSVRIDVRLDEDGERSIVVFSVATGKPDETTELRVEPSRLLYGIDRAAYVDVLRTIDAEERMTVEVGDEVAITDSLQVQLLTKASAQAKPPSVELVEGYNGAFASLRDALRAFLIDEGVVVKPSKRLLNSLLATAEANSGLDWQNREALQARMKIGFRRLLQRSGVHPPVTRDVADRLVTWLKANVPAEASRTGSSKTEAGTVI